jgi:hypothetical protein
MLVEKIIRKINRRLHKNKITSEAFRNDFDLFNSLDLKKRFVNDWDDVQPCVNDNTTVTNFDAHYVYHPAWAARIVETIKPAKHIDISSTLHFCSILSAFVPTEFYDYRPAKLNLSNLLSKEGDLNHLPFETGSVESISCMHTIEHIGLGRYGDKIDPDGDLKAIAELQRVVKSCGNLLLVTPLGKSSLRFNAHRIYSFEMINNLFNDFELKNFSFVDDLDHYVEDADPSIVKKSSFGCGCFWYVKK